MNSDQKAIKYYTEGKVFPLVKTEEAELWGVDGSKVYQVKYDKIKQHYSCNCNNIKLVKCCHIKSVCLYKAEMVKSNEKKVPTMST